MSVDRATKLAVLCWTVVAIGFEAWCVLGWPALPELCAAVMVVCAAAAAFGPSPTIAAILAVTYFVPALHVLTQDRYHATFDILWASALFGAMLPQLVRSDWQIPARWRGSLVAWILVVIVSATIVAVREVDFTFALLKHGRGPTEAFDGIPIFKISWVLHVALMTVIGVLWFDWLWGARQRLDLRRAVMLPLGSSAGVMIGVAIYQSLVNVHFLNYSVYGGLGRASGTLLDGNGMGVVVAFWIGGYAIGAGQLRRGRWLALGLMLPTAWLAIWGSGSRTAFAAAALVTAVVLYDALSGSGGFARAGRKFGIVVLALFIVFVALVTRAKQAADPISRFRPLFNRAPQQVARELWDRNGYGRLATAMIRDQPAFGVGVGSFHLLVSDYASRLDSLAAVDNAQNWYRHQVAELGVVGSLPWIAWAGAFAWFIFAPHHRATPGFRVLGGTLVAFSLVSLVGMPGQVTCIVFTFWTFVFWFAELSGESLPTRPLSRRAWLAISALMVVVATGSTLSALGQLRLPTRAGRMGRDFSYGFHAGEPDGRSGEQRWAGRHAAILIRTGAPQLEVTVSVNHFDIETRPVHARVWLDGELVIDERLSSTAPIVRTVAVRTGSPKVLLETDVDRVVRPRDFNVPDDRELGLLVSWRFVNR